MSSPVVVDVFRKYAHPTVEEERDPTLSATWEVVTV
jgi:hypothetical protein